MDPNYIPLRKGTGDAPASVPVPSHRLTGLDPVSPDAEKARLRADPVIDNFVKQQRQNAALSTTNYHHASLDHPDANVRYENLFGAERITVEPKPIEQAIEQLEEATGIEDAGEPEVPKPPQPPQPILTAGYLMVLYQTQDQHGAQTARVAAVDMAGLGSTSLTAAYTGVAHGSRFVASPGCILPSLQYHLGQTDFVLMPLDLSGTRAASSHHIMTTALKDATPTGAPAGAMPAMNGNENNLMTMGGSFQFKDGTFTRILTMQQDSSLTDLGTTSQAVCPHAIAVDGTSFYFPKLTGECYILPSPKCIVTYQPGDDYNHSLTVASKVQTDIFPTTDTYTALCAQSEVYISDNVTGSSSSDVTWTQTYDIRQVSIAMGPTKQVPPVVAQSYYGKGDFSRLPSVVELKTAYASIDYISFDLSTNQNEIKIGPVGASEVSNRFPYQSISGNQPTIYFMQVDASADFVTSYQKQTDRTKTTVIARAGPISHAYNVNDTPVDQLDHRNYIKQYSVYGFYTPNLPPAPTPPFSDGQLSAWQDSYLAADAGISGSAGSQTYTCTPLVTVSSSSSGVSATGDAPDPSGFPCPLDAITAEISSSSGSTVTASIYLHSPFTYQFDETINSDYHVAFATATLDYHSVADKTTAGTTPIPPDTLVVHSFPPMYGVGGWFTKTTGASGEITVYTPYQQHHNAQDQLKSFTPWLSLTNTKHTIQAYYVDTKPFCYVDGGGSNIIDALAAACGCKATEIVTMVMGVTLDTIKQLADIQAVSYTTTTGGDPGPPPGQGLLPSA